MVEIKECSKLLYDNGYIKAYGIKKIEYSLDKKKYEHKRFIKAEEAKEFGIDIRSKVISRKYQLKINEVIYPLYYKIVDIKINGLYSCVIELAGTKVYIDRCEAYDNQDFHYYYNDISNVELERMEYQAHLKTQVYMMDKEYNKLDREEYNEKYNDVYNAFKNMIFSNYEYNINTQKTKVKRKLEKIKRFNEE